MPDGGHDVAEVHGRNDAVLLFVLLSERLACVFQLQLLGDETRRPLKGSGGIAAPAVAAAT